MHGEAWELCFDDWGMFRYDFGGFGVLETCFGMAQSWGSQPCLEEASGAFCACWALRPLMRGTVALASGSSGGHGPRC